MTYLDLCALAVAVLLAEQAQYSCFIILSPISVQNWELWIPQTTDIGVLKFWMQQELCATMPHKEFSSIWSFLFLIYQGSLLTCSELWSAKNKKFTLQTSFLVY